MPIYEYRCEQCGIFEETQRITDPPLSRCPRCQKKVRRLISQTSFQLKGSGWYVTDYARGNHKPKDAGTDGKADAKADAKPDKPEAKSETKPASGNTAEKSASS
jgi:putative FmdB family regulatory protein